MTTHDHSYKLLFSHPQMVRDLLEGFIREDWLAELDFHSLQKVNATYITDDLRERADDLVWRLRWGPSWIYLYLLLEFQSSVEPYMAVRILTYVGLLYQDLIRSAQLPSDGHLPPVLPIVLYNGSVRWHAAEELSALLQRGPRALEPYRANVRYVLIDQGRYGESELASLRNLVAALFRLENSRTAADIDRVLGTLVEWLKAPEQSSLRGAFVEWVRRVILGRLSGGPVTPVSDLQEMRAMLAERIQEWKEEWKEEFRREGLREGLEEGRQRGIEEGRQRGIEEGRQRGLEEGLQRGCQKGEARLLLRQLQKRFGELPEDVRLRVQNADTVQLETWGERLLEATSVESVFAGISSANGSL